MSKDVESLEILEDDHINLANDNNDVQMESYSVIDLRGNDDVLNDTDHMDKQSQELLPK